MEYWTKSSYDTFVDLEGCGIKFDFTGIDNLKKLDRSVVFIGNHMSNLETFILPSLIAPYKPITFVIKASLIKIPFFGAIMRSTKPICVGRTNPKKDLKYVLKHSIENLNKGISVIIFPQSTRTSGFSSNRFNSLGVKIAAKAGVYAVPLALKTDALEKGKVIKEFGKLNRGKTVYISIGKPVKIKGNGKEQHKMITDYIASQLAGWGVTVN